MAAAPHYRPDPDEGFTIDQAESLLPEHVRFELHEGQIVVMSPAKLWHTETQRRIANILERRGRRVGVEVGLDIAPGETRVLDVAAFHDTPDRYRAYFDPGEITLAVEVVSPSSKKNDYVDKPALYARLGIPEFWRADLDSAGDVHVAMYQLDTDERRYVPTGTVTLDELEDETIDR